MPKYKKLETVKVSVRLEAAKISTLKSFYHTDNMTDVINTLINEKLSNSFSKNAIKPPISGIGAKHRIADKIIKLIPPHKIYIEVFANTAAVLIRKPRSPIEIYCDIDSEVTNFFVVLRDNPIGLYNACMELPYSERLYKEMLLSPIPKDKLERARRFFYTSKCSFMGLRNNGFRTSRTNNVNCANGYIKECEKFYALSERFKGVQIIEGDFRKLLRKYRDHEDAFFFCDPPYLNSDHYYKHPFTFEDHKELSELLHDIKGNCLICHYSDVRINQLYKDFCKSEMQVIKLSAGMVNSVNNKPVKPRKILSLFTNYSPPDYT